MPVFKIITALAQLGFVGILAYVTIYVLKGPESQEPQVSGDCLQSIKDAKISWQFTENKDGDGILEVLFHPEGARAVSKTCKPYVLQPGFIKTQLLSLGYHQFKMELFGGTNGAHIRHSWKDRQ